MATRSYIAQQNADGTFTGVYCHYDGGPDGVGRTLHEHYRDANKVRQLLAGGNISVLGREIGEKHDFHLLDGQTAYYGRDRGDEDEGPETHPNKETLAEAADDMGAAYLYLFREGDWTSSLTFWGSDEA